MDITQVQGLVGWIIGILATSVVSGIIGIISIVRAGKMLPKDLRGADLENRSREVGIADQYEELAERAAQKTIKLQNRLDVYENGQLQLEAGQADLKRQLESQNEVIERQAETIEGLICEINNYKTYTNALIEQIKEAQLIPIDMDSLDLEDCNGYSLRKNKKRKKK